MSLAKSILRRPALVLFTLLLASSPSWAAAPSWGDLAGELGRAALRWLTGGAPSTPKHGCSIDPAGKLVCQALTPKHGCSIDPNGKPVCTP
jgi:hypothetical protein